MQGVGETEKKLTLSNSGQQDYYVAWKNNSWSSI